MNIANKACNLNNFRSSKAMEHCMIIQIIDKGMIIAKSEIFYHKRMKLQLALIYIFSFIFFRLERYPRSHR